MTQFEADINGQPDKKISPLQDPEGTRNAFFVVVRNRVYYASLLVFVSPKDFAGPGVHCHKKGRRINQNI